MRRLRFPVVVGLFAVLIAYTYALRYRDAAPPRTPSLVSIPEEIGGYTGTSEAADPETLRILGADATLFRTYRHGPGRAVWLYIGFFGRQRENSQIHSPKNCYPGSGWNIIEEGSTNLVLAGSGVAVKHLVISNGAQRQYVVYWFTGADGILTNEFALKWSQMKNSLLGRPQAAAFVRFSIDLTGEAEAAARSELVRFAETLAPHINEVLRNSGAFPAGSPHAQRSAASSERTP
ncbi:MAG: exosortase C-terminal domain/associated protein EpsI [Candidatus Krumholzibacteriaceae bacterium]|jgi:EpsI family protein